jgi:hypothetical protein
MQVEARMRQMEGRDLASDSVTKTPGGPTKYDKARANGGLLASTPAAYSTDVDLQIKATEACVHDALAKKSKKARFWS